MLFPTLTARTPRQPPPARHHATGTAPIRIRAEAARPAPIPRPGARCVLFALLTTCLPGVATAAGFTLTSNDFVNGRTLSPRQVYDGAPCHGGNVSPDVAWRNVPARTRSIAVTLFDPDAGHGQGWWHWIVVDLPARAAALPSGAGGASGSMPAGALQARNDFGDSHYDGACPPAGDAPHHYQLTAWALDVPALPVTARSTGPQVLALLKAHVLATARITGRYGR